ncbi:MAG: class I SAM-dependent methyltransferase, partial [Kiritimatiellaeota bacterium]|nr:class I SAM-dependent methyltransferase [Kiritimatiellota bacterium]
ALSPEYHRITRISCADFHYGPQIPGEKTLKILPPLKSGMRALELGCGGAQNSVWLAKRGVICDAFDISEEQLARARKIAAGNKVEINLFCASLSDFKKSADRHYNFLHSSHAMEFAADPAAVVRDMAAVMKRGAWLMISTVHPLFNGDWVEWVDDADENKITKGLFLKNYFSPPDDVRDEFGAHVISRAHTVSDWFRWFKAAGLDVEDLREPSAVKNAPYSSEDWAEAAEGHLSAIPSTIIFLCRKRT